jgi:excisionase family DNA binding protein
MSYRRDSTCRLPRAVASAKDAPCEPVKSATTLPLATASQRLRGRPGRPRTKPSGDNPGDSRERPQTQVRVPVVRPPARTQDSPSCAPPGPRLLTRQQAAEYLNLSLDMIDRLTQQGELRRVQLTLGDRTVRKVLYDRADLDRLVELSRIV